MKKNILIILLLACSSNQLSAQGNFWGLAQYGGANSGGTIFTINPNGNIFNVVYNFTFTTGSRPMGNILQASDGNLYGACWDGGQFASCTIFRYDHNTGTFTDVYDFDITHGDYPASGQVEAPNGKLYGVATSGGFGYAGVIYSYDLATGVYTDVYDFQSAGIDGSSPYDVPVLLNNGKIYGVTLGGGANGAGVLFSFDYTSNVYSKLYDFNMGTGGNPYGKLLYASNGKFYGVTSNGGDNNSGVLYSFDINTNTYSVLHSFNIISGFNPHGGLIETSNGMLYGTCSDGGSNMVGTIFSFNINTNSFNHLYDFDNAHGEHPQYSLTDGNNNKLYGSCMNGGANGSGTLFEFDLNNNSCSVMKNCDVISGSNPNGSFISVTTTGITQQQIIENNVAVFPNPVKDVLTVELNNLSPFNSQYCLRNIAGQQVVMPVPQIANNIFKFDMSKMSNGIYTLEVTADGNKYYRKVIKQ